MQTAEEWIAQGQIEQSGWLVALADVAALSLLAVLVILVTRALVRRQRYRAVAVLGDEQRARLVEEVVEAERRTVGEIVPVVLERSDGHPQARWIAGSVTLVLGIALLSGVLPWDRPLLLLASQAGLFALGCLLAYCLPDFARLFVSERRATEMAEEQAAQEFYTLGLHETQARTGVLIFVSLFERRVIVLGDTGIDAVVDAEYWEAVDEAILAGIRRGDLAGGLVEGLKLCARVLEEHFPWTEGDRNEIPDRVIVRRE